MDRDADALDEVQDQLLTHFQSLANTRKPSGFPVFTLEHGLSPEQIKHIRALLCARIQKRQHLAPHWLLWAIHASEAGYDYKGDEYWPSFETQTPNWQYGDRPKVKSWFQKFQESFSGVEPSGPWAERFSIIAWPITHALLPLYLQRQFAKLLYDLRFRLASASLDAASIGRLLAAHASHTSTRVQAFLEQEELIGQIVAGLLQGESVDADDLIHPPTLNRIVGDLERVRRSRDWLNETRRVVSDRFKGIGRGTYRSPIAEPSPDPGKPHLPDTSRFVIRPDLFLRHDGDGKWSVLLQLKSLRPLASESTELRLFLERTRCRLNGATDWKPTGWLLTGNPKGALRRWPDADRPLIGFEREDPLANHLLESEYRLTPSPLWLFRIGRDGIAHHIASATARPNNDYIVVTTRSTSTDLPELTPCSLKCEAAHAFRLAVPSQVPVEATARLRELGIEVARTIRVWPAGLPGRGWDGDGSTEWLTTESPCFGIAPDHPLNAISFQLNDEPEQVVATEPLGGTTFVRVPPLPVGTHRLTVKAHRSPDLDDAVTTPQAEGFARLAVREPEPWTPGLASHPGLIVTSDPFDASLDVLWRNELDLTVIGPEGYAVSLHLELQTADGKQVLSDSVEDSMPLPITPDMWRLAFAHFLDNEARAWKYLEAASCTLVINGDSLGTCVLSFDHAPSPLRWALTSQRRRTLVHLVDDSGQHDTAPHVRFFSMERPLDSVQLDAESARTGFAVEPPGGLYIAEHQPFVDAAVVSTPPAGLENLGVEPEVHVPSGPPAVRQACQLLRLWHNARQAGFIVNVRRQQVTRCIFSAIFMSICGENWIAAERKFSARPSSPDSVETLHNLVDKRTDFGRRIVSQADAGGSDDATIARFTEEAGRLRISQDRHLCHFALRFAARQDDVLTDPLFEDSVVQLVDIPALLRGARLISVLRKHRPEEQAP